MKINDLWTGRDGKRNATWGRGSRWEVGWQDGPRRPTRRFRTKTEAELFAATLTVSPELRAKQQTLNDLHQKWWDTKAHLAPATRKSYAAAWTVHVQPRWGTHIPADIRPADVQAWIGPLAAKSPSAARRALVVLAQICAHSSSPPPRLDTVRKPKAARRRRDPLTVTQVASLADACGPHRLVPLLLAYVGMRPSELWGVSHADLDRDANTVRIGRQWLDGAWSTPKTEDGYRTAPVPSWLMALIPEGSPDAPVVATTHGNRWSNSSWRRVWRGQVVKGRYSAGALHRAGLGDDIRVYDLRHTFACWAIDAGIDLKRLQRIMGHANLSITINLYGDRAEGRTMQGDLFPAPGV